MKRIARKVDGVLGFGITTNEPVDPLARMPQPQVGEQCTTRAEVFWIAVPRAQDAMRNLTRAT